MRLLSGKFFHVELSGRRFVLALRYDPGRREETDRVLLPGGVETHRRRPIDVEDVRAGVCGCWRWGAGACSRGDPALPAPEQVWDQLWSILQENGLTRTRRPN